MAKVSDFKIGSYAPVVCHDRYGGMAQGHPLTPEETQYDEKCREIDRIEAVIAGLPLSLFTAGQFMWFNSFANKLHFFPDQARLDKQLEMLQSLLSDLTAKAQ